MPEIIKNKIFFSASELVNNTIISENYLNKALYQFRNGKTSTWAHKRFSKHNNKFTEYPLSSRKGNVYILYDSLRGTYKELIKARLYNDSEPDEYIKMQKATERQAELDEFKESLSDYLVVDPDDVAYFTELNQFDLADCHRLARGAAWLRLLNSISVKDARNKGYKSIKELRQSALDIINKELDAHLVRFKAKKLNAVRVLYQYMSDYKVNGLKCLISDKIGNSNSRKITPEISAWLIDRMSDPRKYSFEDVAQLYNQTAKKQEWTMVTTNAIKQHLRRPEILKVWFYRRHGKVAADNLLHSYMQRNRASFADAVWDMDGTALQLYYRDENGKKLLSDLYVYYIVDEHSTAVIGYSVAFTETTELVMEALKNTIQTHGYKPYQLRYDNGRANISNAIKKLMNNMSRVSFPCTPNRGRVKIIETLQGHIEQRVLRGQANFKGGSPSTRNLDSKANPELLKEIKGNLPTRDEVIQQLHQAIKEWNGRGEERDQYGIMQGETKLQQYKHEHAQRIKLNYFEIMSLFTIELTNNQDKQGKYTYRNQGIRIQLFNKTYNYIVPDPDGVGDFVFMNNNFEKKFTVKVNPDNPSVAYLYDNGKFVAEAVEKERYAAGIADMQEGEGSKIRMYQLKQEKFGSEYAKTELERQRQILEKSGMKTGTDGHDWYDLPKHAWNDKESAQVDEINGIKEESNLVKRLKEMGNY